MGSYSWVCSLCAVVLAGSSANAETVHKPVPVPVHAARVPLVKARTTAKPTPTPVKSAPIAAPAPVVAPAPAPLAAPVDVDAPASAVIGDTIAAIEQKPMTETEIVVLYQRVGRDIQVLQNAWGTDKVLDLWPTFRAIKLKEQCKTAEGRLDLQATLEQLRAHIDRRKGITISADCLNNPLSANCQ